MGQVKEGTYYFVVFAAHLFTHKLAHVIIEPLRTVWQKFAITRYIQVWKTLLSTRYLSLIPDEGNQEINCIFALYMLWDMKKIW